MSEQEKREALAYAINVTIAEELHRLVGCASRTQTVDYLMNFREDFTELEHQFSGATLRYFIEESNLIADQLHETEGHIAKALRGLIVPVMDLYMSRLELD